jgi:hypothetical protein
VGNLFDCLYGIHKGLADDSILDRYSEVRREKYYNYIDPMSSANITRLINDPDKAVKEDPFFHMCQEKENDPEAWAQMVKVSDFSIMLSVDKGRPLRAWELTSCRDST